jgi:Glycosyl transferase family 2
MPGSPTTPLLSLCLATYNRARYLDRYLTHHLTALEAAGIDYELVVSDNCSTDETPDILARYSARYPRMRVTRQPRNVGAYPNILTTLHLARGEVVVSIADDDMMLPEQLLHYVRRMSDDPALVMIQAPWLLMDETKDNAIIGKFYDFEGDWRFQSGQYGNCLAFVIQNHVFPECWLMRRSAMPVIVGPTPRFTYSFFAMLAHALGKGDVLFCPEPHLAATAISKGSNTQVGNREAMESWDVYRGGLELLASYARQFNPGDLPDATAVGGAIQGFVCERMAVAARLQAHAQNWSNAYEILRRLHAYELMPQIGVPHDDVARLAAVETALRECGQLGASEIVVGHSIPEHVLDRMNPLDGVRFIRADAASPDDVKRAYCGVGAAVDAAMRAQDFTSDIVLTMERFPTFPPEA